MTYTPEVWENIIATGIEEAGGTEGGTVVVNFTIEDDTVSADKTIDNILEATETGKCVLGMIITSWGPVSAPIGCDDEGNCYLTFNWVEVSGDGGGTITGVLKSQSIAGYIDDGADVWYDDSIAPNGFTLTYNE